MKTIDIPQKEELIKVLRQNNVIFAAIFGSRAKGGASQQSDYDLLVEFDPRAHVGYFKFFEIERNIANFLKSVAKQIEDGFLIKKIIPEGGKEINY